MLGLVHVRFDTQTIPGNPGLLIALVRAGRRGLVLDSWGGD